MSSSSPEAAPASADGASRVGQVVSGRYKLLQLLGEGGMGAVYLAEHTHMRKRVALKVLHEEMSDNAEVLARFEREAMAASHIEHPNVAGATDFGRTEEGGFFLVLEYVEGILLRDVVGHGALSWQRALKIARQIALALERAHEAGIVHRDLKPENVMLVRREDDEDFVKVLDFGIAKVSDRTITARGGDAAQPLTRLGTVLGTPEYMAPEQALGEAVTPAADLYAVGIMLYEMLTGLLPFDPPDRMAMLSFHIVAPVPKMEERAPAVTVPPAVEAVVAKLLEKDAKLRYPDARALVEAIDQAAAASGFGPDGATASPAPPDGAQRIAVSSGQVVPADPSSATGANAAWRDTDNFAKTNLDLPAAERRKVTPTLEGLVETFKKQPRPVQIGLGAAPIVLLLLVLAISSALRSAPAAANGAQPSSSAAESPPDKTRPKLAPADEVKAAGAQGAAALDALAKEYPDDPSIPRQIALALAAQGRKAEALKKIRELAGSDARAASHPELLKVVTQAAEGLDEDAFALLEGPLGDRGVDALIDLSGRAQHPLRTRAARALQKPEVRAHASPAAAVYLDMKDAKRCAARQELLDRARESGDARLLGVLRKMKEPRGCGFVGTRDCWPCMRKDSALDDAVQAVEQRSK